MAKANKNKFDLGATTEKLRDPQDGIRMGALAEIVVGGAAPHALQEIAECLNDPSERVRRAAVTVLGEAGPTAIVMLARALDEKQPCAIRMLGASTLARWGDTASSAVSALIGCLKSEDEPLRQVAALALGKIGDAAVPQLRMLLSNSISPACIAAAEALGYAGHAAAEALNDLKQIAKSEAPLRLRVAFAAAALMIDGDSQDELSLMLKALVDSDDLIRLDVLEKLGRCRSNAEIAAPAVVQCLSAESPQIRANAALTLGRVCSSTSAMITALVSLLGDREMTVRLNAATALSGFGPNASKATAALQNLEKDPDSRVAAAAAATIGRIQSERA